MAKGWEVYAPDWGCADWTVFDWAWEVADDCTGYRPYRLFSQELHYMLCTDVHGSLINGLQLAHFFNDGAVPIWNSLRFTSQPEDLRLVSCARRIKKAFRRASNDPSYKMCRRRILTLLYS